MRLKLSLLRSTGESSDIVVTVDAAASITEIGDRIQKSDPLATSSSWYAAPTLAVRLPGQRGELTMAPDAAVSDAWIASGAQVRLADGGVHYSPHDAGQAPTVATLTIVNGPDAGRVHALRAGTVPVGRDADNEIVLDDLLVSKRHLRLEVGAVVEAIDLGSANGIVVDGGLVQRVQIRESETLLIGDTELRIEVSPTVGLTDAPAGGPIHFNRSPRVEERYFGTEFAAPEVPAEPEDRPFPWLALLAPAMLGIGLYLATGTLRSLVFVALTPVMLLGTFLTQRQMEKRKLKKAIARFEERLRGLTEELDREIPREQAMRLAEAPSTSDAYDQAIRRGPLLWTRRPEHWSFLNVRLGVGTMASRNSVAVKARGELLPEFQERLDAVVDAHRRVEGVPLVDNLFESGALGIAGAPAAASGSVNSVLVQLTALHSPAEVVVAALVTPAWSRRLEWLKWMPHTSSPHSPIDVTHLSDSASSGAQLLESLEGLLQARLGQRAREVRRGAMKHADAALERGSDVGGRETESGTQSPLPAIVLLISDDVGLDRARLVQLAERAADAGIYPIWLAGDRASLPAVCRTYLELPEEGGVGTVGFVRLGETITDVETEVVDDERALDYAMRMAAVIDAGALVADSSDLPRSVSLVSLLGHELVESPSAVLDRWRQNESIHDRTATTMVRQRRTGKLRAIVGSAGADVMQLDLRSQGPHALVGGTTGAGKSEFLQAWVLGMAAEYSPDRVTFLFVDYKGGSAFADCVTLPHCVGLVTDLSPHLVRRALTSLRAELHYREHLLNRKKAKDLLELEKRGDPASPPALVLVVDEFAALVGEVPEFVDGVVDIAQRGRSLGIHLILATQRPAGVIKDNLRANTNLRVALRMADESDSSDVVGVKDSAHFDPSVPGRGLVKTGPGRLSMFQSAYAGGWTLREPERASIGVAELRFGSEQSWDVAVGAPVEAADPGPTDQARLVGTIIAAAIKADIPAPRRPWLDEIGSVYDLTKLRQRTDADLVLGVCDVPERQEQLQVYFHPDTDGHLAVYGTGGAGKSTVLRTLAAAAGITPRGGPVHVYALDFGAGSLRMLRELPHVGAVIAGDDIERIARLFRMLRGELDRRATSYADAGASSVSEYRQFAGKPDEARILLLIDGFPSFREDFEIPTGRSVWYDVFRDILTDGRQLGMHVVFTTDRSGSVPTQIGASVQKRVVLRLADESGYSLLGEPGDVVGAGSPPGRAVIGGLEMQIAILGDSAEMSAQAAAVGRLAAAITKMGVRPAPEIASMPKEFPPSRLPAVHDGMPVLGLGETTLGPLTFDPAGVMLLAGPPASGRTNAMTAIVEAVARFDPDARLYYIGNPRSPLAGLRTWTGAATTVEEAQSLARDLSAAIADGDTEGRIAVFIESLNDFLQSPADAPLVELIKAAKRSPHFLLADADTSGWSSSWPLIAEVKNTRRGILLQPDPIEGDLILKTSLPRAAKSEFPPGRGYFIARGKFERVQLPLVALEQPGHE